MAVDPLKGHEALRRGRWSVAGCDYFLTFCTRQRRAGLHAVNLQTVLLTQALTLETESIWTLRAFVVMPDHLHALITLSEGTELAIAVRLFKGRTVGALRSAGLGWQPAYFDHRIRTNEDVSPVLRYMLNNPYRAGLAKPEEAWPGFYCSPTDQVWFEPLTNDGSPPPQWLIEKRTPP